MRKTLVEWILQIQLAQNEVAPLLQYWEWYLHFGDFIYSTVSERVPRFWIDTHTVFDQEVFLASSLHMCQIVPALKIYTFLFFHRI